MRILNPQVKEDIKNGRPLHLNLGAGPGAKEGFYSVDLLEMEGMDIVANLNEPLDEIPDNSVIEIFSRHTFEHINNLFGLMAELHRITRKDGRIHIQVPHFSNPHYYSDPTHVRFFGYYTFYYFVDEALQPARTVPSFYTPTRIVVDRVWIEFYGDSWVDRQLVRVIKRLVNYNDWTKGLYERHFCWLYPAWQINYVFSPQK